MKTRREFLVIGGAVAASAALPGGEVAATPKVLFNTDRYVRAGLMCRAAYVRPGTYIAPMYQYTFPVDTISEFLAFLLAADMHAPDTKMSIEFSPVDSGGYQVEISGTYLPPREYEFIRKAARKLVKDEHRTILHKLTSRLTSWKNRLLIKWKEPS